MFNAERAYEEGDALHKHRLDSLPTDTLWSTQGERVKYDRVIEKCSRVLERFPDDIKYKPRAVFLIAESFRKKGEWSKAITKYDEFERYFSNNDSMPAVEYERAFCLYKNRDYAVARFALDHLLAKGITHPYYAQSLHLLSILEEQSNMPELAIADLEKVLASKIGTPFLRAKMYLRLAELYFKQENWQKSRDNYKSPTIDLLDLSDRLRAATQGVECLAKQGRYAEAAKELEGFESNKDFIQQLSTMQVRRGELLLAADSTTQGLNLLLKVAHTSSRRTEVPARAWYGMGDYEQVKRKNYAVAGHHYDSAWAVGASNDWGRKAKQRRDALFQLSGLEARGSDTGKTKLSNREEFQIAELFLFKLSEVDSAIHTLDRIVERSTQTATTSPQDSLVLERAFYARAFIIDEFKSDTIHADSLYREIILRFPGTKFAQRAQLNLGQRITQKTIDDYAHEAFLHAESLWVSLETIPVENIALADSTFSHCVRAYDSVATKYLGTEDGGRALWAEAWILENQGANLDSARILYERIR